MSLISSIYKYFYPSAPAENTNSASSSAEAVAHQASRAALNEVGSWRAIPVASNGSRYASWVDVVKGAPLAGESVAQTSDQSQVMMEAATGAAELGFVMVDSSSIPN